MAAGATYEPIASTTVSTTTNTVTFSSIPSTYTDLIIVGNYQATSNTSVLGLRLNSDSGTNYSRTLLWGNSTDPGNYSEANATAYNTGYWQTGTGNQIQTVIHLQNYANTTTNKTFLSRWNQILGIDNSTTVSVGLWRSTAAVSTITLVTSTGNYTTGSIFSIYGIAAA